MKRRGARLFTFKVSMGGPQLLSRHWRRAGGAALEVLGGTQVEALHLQRAVARKHPGQRAGRSGGLCQRTFLARPPLLRTLGTWAVAS